MKTYHEKIQIGVYNEDLQWKTAYLNNLKIKYIAYVSLRLSMFHVNTFCGQKGKSQCQKLDISKCFCAIFLAF